MTQFKEGSAWVADAGLDPDLTDLDDEQFMQDNRDKLLAIGSKVIDMLERFGLQHLSYLQGGYTPTQGDRHKQ